MDDSVSLGDWFLTPGQRGNPHTTIDERRDDGSTWTRGNSVTLLVHGSTYFSALLDAVEKLGPGDLLLFTDWRGDAEQRLDGPGTEVGAVFAAAAARGVDVRGLMWRSHHFLQWGTAKNRGFGMQVKAAGGEVLLDTRVPMFGAHHQKVVIARYASRPELDVAFVGGIDLCRGRRDTDAHRGDPLPLPMAKVYGERPPWHDVQLEVRGPAVGDLEASFRERWNDPSLVSTHPAHVIASWVTREPIRASPLPEQRPDPAPCGSVAVQVLRTYAARRPSYPFARKGERSIARGYIKALLNARRLVYVEDQYLWSSEVASMYAAALRRSPELQLVVVVPAYAEQDGRISTPPNNYGRLLALDVLRRAGRSRVSVFSLENDEGTPIYVHSKTCIIDDIWACVGSDNTNRRSWTHDSEMSAAIIDETGSTVADFRFQLAEEHLGRPLTDDEREDPRKFVAGLRASAAALDSWHARADGTARPPGQLREFTETLLNRRTRLWAARLYHHVYDPDGRPRTHHGRRGF